MFFLSLILMGQIDAKTTLGKIALIALAAMATRHAWGRFLHDNSGLSRALRRWRSTHRPL